MINYALDGTEPKGLADVQLMAFLLIRPTLDAARRMSKGVMKTKEKKKAAEAAAKVDARSDQGSVKVEPRSEQGSVKVEPRSEQGVPKEYEVEVEGELELKKESETELESENERLKAAFAGFWEQYPVKSKQQEAWLAWLEVQPDLDEQLEALRLWKLSDQWRKDKGRYIPSAHRFIREKHARKIPDDVPRGANGVLGEAELEAIFAVMGHEGG